MQILKRTIYILIAITFFSTGSLLLFGTALIAPNPKPIDQAATDLPIQSIKIKGGSGPYVSAWYIPHPEEKAAILLLHGLRSNRLSMISRAKFLHQAGYSVLMPDFQGHGESPGDYITFGYKEGQDAKAAVSYLKQDKPERKVAVIGISLGGAAALLGKKPLEVDAAVLEAVYSGIEKATENRMVIKFGDAGSYLVPLLMLQIEPRLGMPVKELRPVTRISALKAPVLVIAGEIDDRTTLDESKMLYERAPDPKEFWVVKGAGHVDFHKFVGNEYEQRILGFLQKHLAVE